MQVIGPVSDQLYVAAFQNSGTGSFSAGGALPDTTPYVAAEAGAGYNGLQVIGVGANDALLYSADSQNTNTGTWSVGAGELPGQIAPGISGHVPISSPVVAGGAGGLQVGGLGTNDGLLHMVAYQSSSSGTWTAFGYIPTYNNTCPEGTTCNPYTQIIASPAYSSSLALIGLDTASNIVLITTQNSGGTWTQGSVLTGP
jgi:hypothetical protein